MLTAAALAVVPTTANAGDRATQVTTPAPPVASAQQNAAHDGLTTQTLTGDLHELWHRDFTGRPSFAVVAAGRIFTVVAQYERNEGARCTRSTSRPAQLCGAPPTWAATAASACPRTTPGACTRSTP